MSNETIFREVDEELRGDRMRNFWRTFGPYIIGAAVLVVLAVAVNEGWRWWQSSNASRSSDQFYVALEAAEKGDIPAAQKALDDVEASGSGGYPTLARFREAALLARQGDTTGAIAAYDALATSESNQHLRDLALVLGANLLVDKGDVPAVQQRVGGLLIEGNPMRNSAREALGLTQYKAGDLNAALQTFTDIAADPLANNELLQRVRIYIAQLGALGAMTAQQQAAATAAAETPAAEAAAASEAAPAAEGAPAGVEPATPAAGGTMMAAPEGTTPAMTMSAPGADAPGAMAATTAAPAPAAETAPAAPAETPASAPANPNAMQPAPANATPAVTMQAPSSAP